MIGYENVPYNQAPAIVSTSPEGVVHQQLWFHCPGVPVPKGNVIKGRWGGYHDPTKGLPEWMTQLERAGRAAIKGTGRVWPLASGKQDSDSLPLFCGAIALDIVFVLPSPKTHTHPAWMNGLEDGKAIWKALRQLHTPPPAIKKPDTDKLIRAVCDAFTGTVWHDDAQVIDIHASKRLAEPDERPGAAFYVTDDVLILPGAAYAAGGLRLPIALAGHRTHGTPRETKSAAADPRYAWLDE